MVDTRVDLRSDDLPAEAPSSTLLRFRSPARPIDEVLLNLHATDPVILDRPERGRLLELLRSVEQQYVHSFWENVLCKQSPYVPQLPLALASWDKKKNPLITAEMVLKLTSQDPTSRQIARTSDISSIPFDSLVSAIRAIEPSSICDALKLLSKLGVQRFNAASIIGIGSDCADFNAAVNQLLRRAEQKDGRIAAMALIALRVEGLIALPSGVVQRIRLLDSLRAEDGWDPLISFVTSELKELYDQLLPPTLREGGSLYKNTAFRIYSIVLSTNVATVDELSWPLAYSLLKGTDFCPELRNHWRDLCRRNAEKYGVVVSDSNTDEETKRSAWSPSEAVLSDIDTCEKFVDPSDASSTILFNLGSSTAILLGDVAQAELKPLLEQVEQQWINVFWSTLTKASPHDPGLPFGLQATKAGHSLVDPVLLAGTSTGHYDLYAEEAMEELRLMGCDHLIKLIETIRPNTITCCLRLLTKNGALRLKAFSLFDVARQCNSFSDFVNSLVRTATTDDKRKAFAIATLIALRSCNWLILPLSVPRALSNVQRGISGATTEWIQDPVLAVSGDANKLMSTLMGSQPLGGTDRHTSSLQTMSTIAVLCSNLRNCGQLNLGLVERVLGQGRDTTLCYSAEDSRPIRAHWTRLCELNGPTAMLPPSKIEPDYRSELVRRCRDPRLGEWIDLLSERCVKHGGGNMEPVYQAYSTWLGWLSLQPDIPGVFEILRGHINGRGFPEKGFREHLQGLDISAKQKNVRLFLLNDVFEHLATEAEAASKRFSNPIRTNLDKFHEDRSLSGQGTHRSRIPALVLDEMKLLIAEPTEDGGFRWSQQLERIPMLFEGGADSGKKVFCPILPAIIYIMLVFPLRTHQTRWLDSGEMDEETYDFTANHFVPNYENGREGRRSGVIVRGNSSSSEETALLDFQVAVNKTVLTQRMRSSYTIPFLPADVLWILKEALTYQKSFGPPAHLVKEVHEPVQRRRRNQGLAGLYPDICPLFRSRSQRSFFPPTHTQIAYFWGRFCALWDDLNVSWVNSTTGKAQPRPGLPQMARPYVGKQGNTWWVANFDLHSLRVASVSSLLEAGLPLAMVAALAGHKSVAMTLHYFKADMARLRIKLKEAFDKMPPGETAYGIAKYLRESDEESLFLGNPKGLEKLRIVRKTGLPTISTFGICPGASCQEGFAPEFGPKAATGVPGARCALCRFFVYGPAFLPGLVYEFNCVLMELERKAKVQAQVREAALRAEDEGRVGEALHLRGEDDRIDREASLDIAVLGKLYVILNECINAYNTRPLSLEGLQVISQETKLEMVLKQVTRFDKLKELVEVSQIQPAGRHVSSAIAELELKDILLGMLRRNGAEAYLAGLPKEVTRTATIELAQLLESMVPDSDKRDRLLHGLIAIGEVPGLEKKLKQLMDHTHAELQRLALNSQTLPPPRSWLSLIAPARPEVTYE